MVARFLILTGNSSGGSPPRIQARPPPTPNARLVSGVGGAICLLGTEDCSIAWELGWWIKKNLLTLGQKVRTWRTPSPGLCLLMRLPDDLLCFPASESHLGLPPTPQQFREVLRAGRGGLGRPHPFLQDVFFLPSTGGEPPG